MSGLHVWNVYIYHYAYYIIQLCTITIKKNVCVVYDLRQVGGFLRVLRSLTVTNKADRHDITEILLKLALNFITLTLGLRIFIFLIYFLFFLFSLLRHISQYVIQISCFFFFLTFGCVGITFDTFFTSSVICL
jgi:hypothetical protein